MDFFTGDGFGFVGFFEAAADEGGANVGVGYVCHPCRSPKRYSCCRCHFLLLLLLALSLSLFSSSSSSSVSWFCFHPFEMRIYREAKFQSPPSILKLPMRKFVNRSFLFFVCDGVWISWKLCFFFFFEMFYVTMHIKYNFVWSCYWSCVFFFFFI